MIFKVLLAGLISGLFQLDQTGAFQFMLSRSIISSTILGWVLGSIIGQPELGLRYGFLFGIFFDLIWLFRLPIGASTPPDYQIGSSVAISSLILGISFFNPKFIYIYVFICLVMGFVSGYIGAWFDVIIRRLNINISRMSRYYWNKGKFLKFKSLMLLGLFNSFVKAFLITIVFLFLILILNPILNFIFENIPGFIVEGFAIVIFFIPALGLIVVINHIIKESTWKVLGLGIVTGAIIFSYLKDFHVFGFLIILFFCIIIWVNVLKKEKV
ncbi:PTS sugar transporter subunit IIC [Candidatus Dependentiae bacterium]|nr:PTS sugar transporter subunit IIC [Candidatus Dependentiae bacterium]